MTLNSLETHPCFKCIVQSMCMDSCEELLSYYRKRADPTIKKRQEEAQEKKESKNE